MSKNSEIDDKLYYMIDELKEYVYATYYGLVMREVWAKGGRELTTSEMEYCKGLTEKVTDRVVKIAKYCKKEES